MTRVSRVIGLAVVLAVTWRAGIAAAAGKFVVGYAAMNARLAPLCLRKNRVTLPNTGWNPRRSFCAAQHC